ncbi:MAG TPA: hypothetical protein PK573_16950 [Spirochaetota bacterium]|nr:hypothetical protein [Spirochaetota bacterium]HRZ29208.1 hypothetical protein [Spirochaetota bacterium]HSA16633.1 hypothetical protein [Spirochaetota bacterium]
MEKSMLFITCPRCGKNELLIEKNGQHLCSSCLFNYTELKEDSLKLDEVLVENINTKGLGPMFASCLYQKLTLAHPLEANRYIQELAEKNGIDIIHGHRIPVDSIDGLCRMLKL